jgi:hypothetical protein
MVKKGAERVIVLTDASIVDEDCGVAMSLANLATEINEIREVSDVALIVVDVRHYNEVRIAE